AIKIINLPEELKEHPIHQYSKNGFRLFSLPIPIFGKVVGLIGKNGIGKSTALNILSGVLEPNFGDYEKQKGSFDCDQLIELFKGTEAQIFFEKVKNKEIKISYKPQNVDMIPKNFEGTVRELLMKVDEKKEFEKITEKLELTHVLDTDIKKISGGELQRTAIAAALLKDANLFVFDEPTSYLDIKQRLKIAEIIKSLANEKTAVMVVEHDLIILDYMTDLIHITYGAENAYGVISHTKSTKQGINEYLEGYMTDENVRFRDHKISFETFKTSAFSFPQTIVSWKGIKKQLGKFSLSADEGIIKQNELIGVLGENGIGKTSFVKILAKETEPDNGEVNEKIKVSYKPQTLNASDSIVREILKDAIEHYYRELITGLELEPLLDSRLDELSGGQLQRVAIADCLSKNAELYLLDEPSAYLDIEQRLAISRIIRDMMFRKNASSLIVDHDLLFIDYLSQKLIVFNGKPAISGLVTGPFSMTDGMNKFLKELEITFRRDHETGRPRTNKKDSQMDQKQKKEGNYYYTEI
ncbi:MAG TPA: ribosome biogenesis/translation initiation ATPase RLI, partial [bacterium]|nr:ribosome biogenesis/translation initiation ATPase RLI [bacterium]